MLLNYAVNGDIWFETEDIDITGMTSALTGWTLVGSTITQLCTRLVRSLAELYFDTGDDQSNGDDSLPLSKDCFEILS